MPLVRSWWLGKKKGKEAWVRPIIVADPGHPSGKRVEFEIGHGRRSAGAPSADEDGTVGRNGATCVACGSAVALDYVRATRRERRAWARSSWRSWPRATGGACTCRRRRAHGAPRDVERPDERARGEPATTRGTRIPRPELRPDAVGGPFTNRQLLALTTFSDLVMEARERVLRDALAAGAPPGDRLESGGTDAEAYADAVATYLGLRCRAACRLRQLARCAGASPQGDRRETPVRAAGDPDGLGLRRGQSVRDGRAAAWSR